MIRRAAALAGVLVAAAPAAADVLAVTGGRVITQGPAGIVDGANVILRDGRIAAVGKDAAVPAGARVIDARGKVVVPGFLDAHSRIGLLEISAEPSTVDADEGSDPVVPQVRAIDGFHLSSKAIRVARQGGVTAAFVSPGEQTVLAGECAVVKLSGRGLDAIVVKAPAGMAVNLGEAPKRTWGPKNKAPMTRMGGAAVLRGALTDARNYIVKWDTYKKDADDWAKGKRKGKKEAPAPPDKDLKMEALARVLRREVPLVVTAARQDDLVTALRVAEEFGVRLVLNHATDAYKIAPRLAAAKVPVIVTPVRVTPGEMEEQGARLDNAALLAGAGVRVAIGTDEVYNVRNLPFEAAFAATYGLGAERALAAITIEAARILGVEGRLGSLEVGKDADLVVFNGDPLSVMSRPVAVVIDGVVVDGG